MRRAIAALSLVALALTYQLAGLRHEAPDQLLQVHAYQPVAGAPADAYWTIPEGHRAAESSAGDETTLVTADENAVAMGAGFARNHFTFTTAFDGKAILSFQPDDVNTYYGADIEGLRVMAGRDSDGALVAAPVLAVGTVAPYTVVAFPAGEHELSLTVDGPRAVVNLDGKQVWAGEHHWASGEGIYPKLAIPAESQVRVSTVPEVLVAFPNAGPVADDIDEFRDHFTSAVLAAQRPSGVYALDNSTDAWTATALVYEYRRTHDPAVAASLDRWAGHEASIYTPAHAWPGTPGQSSINQNVGEPGIALALWARQRGRADWARIVADMVAASGWTGCGIEASGWCRMGNLQPDGTVIVTGQPGANYTLNHFQMPETAGFIAGSMLDNHQQMARRRAWIESLPERTYDSPDWQFVETLGLVRGEHDERPWWMRSRKYGPMMLMMLALDYQAAPNDPVWRSPAVRRLLVDNFAALRWQVVGPAGWASANEETNFTIGTQELFAAEAFRPLLGETLTGQVRDERLAAQWWRLADANTLTVRGTTLDRSGLPGFWAATMVVMLDGAGVDATPNVSPFLVSR